MRETPPKSTEHAEVKQIYDDLDGEIDLYELVQSIWHHKWIVAATTFLTIIGAVIYLNIATYKYTVTLKVVPVNEKGGDLGGSLGGFAALAGINLPGDNAVTQFDLYLELLTSQKTAERISLYPDVMQVIFAEEWNAENNSWMEPAGVLRDLKDQLKSMLGIPIYPWKPPNGIRLREFLEEAITIRKGRDSAVTSLSIDVKNVSFGKDLLWKLHEAVDASLRDLTLEKTGRHIDYLWRLLAKATVADYRQALIENLSAQEKSRMMASSGLFFAAEPLSKPSAPMRPNKPKPVPILVLSIISGLFLGIMIVLTGNWLRNQTGESGAVSSSARRTELGKFL